MAHENSNLKIKKFKTKELERDTYKKPVQKATKKSQKSSKITKSGNIKLTKANYDSNKSSKNTKRKTVKAKDALKSSFDKK